MEKTYNFVFITTNLVNGKQYVGDHSTNDMNAYKTKRYLGSGKRMLWPAVKKYGRENFKREILEFFPTKQEAFNNQEKYIKLYKTHVSQGGYNISEMGGSQCKGGISEITRKRMSIIQKEVQNKPEIKEKIRKTLLNHIVSSETKEKISKKQKGKKHSEITKQKMSKNISKSLTGRKLSEEHKNNISIALKKKRGIFF